MSTTYRKVTLYNLYSLTNWHFHPRDWYSHIADESSIPIPRLKTIQDLIFALFFLSNRVDLFFLGLKNQRCHRIVYSRLTEIQANGRRLRLFRNLMASILCCAEKSLSWSAEANFLHRCNCFVLFRFARWFVCLLHFPTMTSNFKIENLHFYLKQDSFKITLAAVSIFKNLVTHLNVLIGISWSYFVTSELTFKELL